MTPPIMAGIVAIYGLVVSVLIVSALEEKSALHSNFMMLAAGLSVGISGLASGLSIGIIGDAGVRGTAQQPKLFVGMAMLLVFAEALGLYGAIVAIMLISKSSTNVTECF
jgi:V-type H+-transporting ATPase proteolipid subunit